MKRKKKGRFCKRAGVVVLLAALLFGMRAESAAASYYEAYPQTEEGKKISGKEKQLLANSYSGEYKIEFSYGFEKNYQDGNHVPFCATISNESAVTFEGYFVFQVWNDTTSIYQDSNTNAILAKLFPGVNRTEDNRDSLFTYRFPVYIPANSEITKEFSAGLMTDSASYCVLSLENGRKDTVYSREETISNENFFHSGVQVCVIEEDTDYGRQLNGITLNDGICEIDASSVRPDELHGIVDSYAPDVLILLEEKEEDLDPDVQQEIDQWEEEGGLLVSFAGGNIYTESQRNAFKEDPAEFLRNILDADTVAQLTAKRNANYQKYYTIGDALENTKVRNRPNIALYGILILVYLVLAGPGLYLILKKTGKRKYLWGGICACSAIFLAIISLLGRNTQMKAPVLTYVREIWNYSDYEKDFINFCAQAPYSASYALYLDPSYDLVTYNRMDYVSSNGNVTWKEKEESAREKTEITFGEKKNKVELSNMAAFCLNEFGMQKTRQLEKTEGLCVSVQFWDQTVSGTVQNKTGYDLENCVLVLPGHCVWIGTMKNGEEKILDQAPADSVREINQWDALKDLSEVEKSYLNGVVYNHTPNRSSNCLFFGKIAKEDPSFQMDSGYEAYGFSYYFTQTAVDMMQGDEVYCPYAQEYSGWDGETLSFEMGPDSGGISDEETEVTYYLNGIFEDNNIWKLYGEYLKQYAGPDRTGLSSPDFWPYAMRTMRERIVAAENGKGEKRGQISSVSFRKTTENADTGIHSFDGTISLYNYKTEAYEELPDWEIDFTADPSLLDAYVSEENEIRVRYQLSDEVKKEEYHQKYGYYETPDLIVKGKKLQVDEYLGNLFAEDADANTED